jgi:N-acetyl-anhydromuramyl-L-alanine amidase AmpD
VADTRTAAQKKALLTLLKKLKTEHPQARILGHRDLPNVAKACPCFDAMTEYSQLNGNQKLGKADFLSV